MPAILATPNVPLARAWNTWAADRYLEMTFQPLGVRITPMIYAASTGKATFVGPGADVRLGAHATDGALVEARVTHAGTSLDWRWRRAEPYELTGGWRTEHFGEWGLRVWVVLCLSAESGGTWHYDEDTHTAWHTHGPRTIAVTAERAPLLVTGHGSVAAVASEYETQGYWYLASRASAARVLALRFNLEEMAENRIAAAIADRPDLAIARAGELVRSAAAAKPEPARDSGEPALAAVRDIMGWNTIWDAVNHRPYITCSRNWDLKKFGGFGFWLNDTAINALLVSLIDPDQGRETLQALLYGATPAGNLPCLITGNDQWVDRTQNPLVGFITWQMFQLNRSLGFLEQAYHVLAGNNAWLLTARDGNGNGLLEYGSSAVGLGLYAGTKLAAKDESFMDNSPVHDEARWHEPSRTLDCEDVGLNSLAALDCEMLAMMAHELGLGEAAAAHEARAARLRVAIRERLWDGERKIFANRLWSGKFVRSLAPTSFFPLLCGAASAEQTAHLLKHLEDPKTFGGRFGLPSVTRDDPAAKDNVYWRGRIWPILNWLVWNGLKRAGEDAAAARLADKSWALFEATWTRLRQAPENYNAETGEGLDQADTDPFYSWTALVPFMQVASVIEASPWTGLTLHVSGPDAKVGPIASPFGRITVERSAGEVRVMREGREILAARLDGALSGINIAQNSVNLHISGQESDMSWLRIGHQILGDRPICLMAGKPVNLTAKGDAYEIRLPKAVDRRRLVAVAG